MAQIANSIYASSNRPEQPTASRTSFQSPVEVFMRAFVRHVYDNLEVAGFSSQSDMYHLKFISLQLLPLFLFPPFMMPLLGLTWTLPLN